MQSILYRPIITEKSLGLASRGWYTFAVDQYARKEEIAREIEKTYSVNVISMRTIAMHGKVRRTGKKMVRMQKPNWKKAIAQVKAGQRIGAFEVTAQEPVEEAPKAVAPKESKSEEKAEAKKLETQQKGKVKK